MTRILAIWCAGCRTDVPVERFAPSSVKLGRSRRCRDCMRVYYERNKEKIMERGRARRATAAGREQEAKWQRDRRRNQPITRMLQEAKVRATKKGLPFGITASHIAIPSICPVLGIPIFRGDGGRCDNSPSIDRIDQAQGYVPGNVVVMSWRANRLKNDATLAELEAIVAFCRAAGLQ